MKDCTSMYEYACKDHMTEVYFETPAMPTTEIEKLVLCSELGTTTEKVYTTDQIIDMINNRFEFKYTHDELYGKINFALDILSTSMHEYRLELKTGDEGDDMILIHYYKERVVNAFLHNIRYNPKCLEDM